MLRRLADADEIPVASDAPETSGAAGVPYDAALQVELEEYGPEALEEYGKIVVRGVSDPARYNAGLHYALSYDLDYVFDGETLTLTERPKHA